MRGSRLEWETGAGKGCLTCAVILSAVDQIIGLHKDLDPYDVSEPSRRYVAPDSFIVRRELGTFIVSGNDGRYHRELFKKSDTASLNQCEAIPIMESNSASTCSDVAFEFCRVRLQSCIKTHADCREQHVYRYPLPKRVIDIRYSHSTLIDGRKGFFQPRLVELGNNECIEYVTLSHCWGQKQIITTTRDTLKSLIDSIPWEWLSITFQEAIHITHKLGYRYIWIDSLCIVQDDPLDWELESKKMSSTYQNSIFTIAASKAKNGDSGCFTSTPDLAGEELCVTHTNTPSGIFWRRLMHEFEPGPRHQHASQGWPLSLRAWALQEELLSTRVIYYGPNELLWQCNTTLNCQCGKFHRAIPCDHMCGLQNKALFSAVLNRELHKSTAVSTHQRSLEILWAQVITQYSMRQLTRETDRLPALSGLAKRFQAAGLASLIAGIPANNVLPWLVWDCHSSAERQSVYTAPSWSWASISCRYKINFNHYYFSQPVLNPTADPIAQVVDIVAEATGQDPTGSLKSGHLVLYSRVTPVALKYCRVEGVKAVFPDDFNLGLCMQDPVGREDVIRNRGLDFAEDKQNLIGQDLLCVFICCTRRSPDSPSLLTHGLVLASVEELLFRRVGWCSWSEGEPWKGCELREITII